MSFCALHLPVSLIALFHLPSFFASSAFLLRRQCALFKIQFRMFHGIEDLRREKRHKAGNQNGWGRSNFCRCDI